MSERTWTVVLVPLRVPEGLDIKDFVAVERVSVPMPKAIETAKARVHELFGTTDELVPLGAVALMPGAPLIRATDFPFVRVDARKIRETKPKSGSEENSSCVSGEA